MKDHEGWLEGWSPMWPTLPGMYWFVGWGWKSAWQDEPEILLVKVAMSGNKIPMYIAGAFFIWYAEGARGLWRPATLPDIPSGSLRKRMEVLKK